MRSLTRLSLSAAVTGALLAAGAASAMAAPIVDSPWAKLPNTTKVPAIASDHDGNLYALTTSGAVMRVDADGTVNTTWASVGSTNPQDVIVLPDGSVMTANGKASTASHIDSTGKTTTIGLPLAEPSELAYLGGAVYTSNPGTKSISKIDPATNSVVDAQFVTLLSAPATIEASGSALFVLDGGYIAKIGPDKTKNESFIELPVAAYITDMAVTSDGRVLLLDATSKTLRTYEASGKLASTQPITEFTLGLIVDAYDNAYVTDYQSNIVSWMRNGTSTLTPLATFTGTDPVRPNTLTVSGTGALYASGYDTTLIGRVSLVPTVASPPISTSITVGTRFSVQLSSAGGADPVTMSTSVLPSWLSLDPATGILSGTPTTEGVFTFEISATNAAGASAPQPASITVTAVITPSPTPTSSAGGGGNDSAGPGPSTGNAVSNSGRTLASTGSEAGLLAAAAVALLGLGAAGAVVHRRRQRV